MSDFIQSGEGLATTCGTTYSGGLCDTPQFIDISFPRPYRFTPKVSVAYARLIENTSCLGGAVDAVYAKAVNVTQTGFRLYAAASPSGSVCGAAYDGWWYYANASWLAVGR